MTQQRLTQEHRYVAAFDSFERNGAAGDPSWVRALRREAIARFTDRGFPVARRGNEEWKYTDVGPIAKAPVQALLPPTPARVKARDLKRFTFGEPRWGRLVFVDGRYVEGLSSLSSPPAGVKVLNLAEAMATPATADLVRHHLARYAEYESQAFTALNTAFVHDGAVVHIPDGVLAEEPIHLLFLSPSHGEESVSHPRVLVVAGKGSKATIVESHGGLSEGRYFANAVTEVVGGAGSVVNYYRVQRHGERAFHVGTTQVVLGRDSAFSSVTADLGGGLVRNNLNVLTGDEGGRCMLNGIYIVTGSQHVDNQVVIDHARPHTTSRELYKGILDGKSRAVFHGSIIVREGAQKVDARQEDKNLLLSDQAEADSKPAFWIYADDVKCSHGAACGKLDETALFYLRSRGIDERTARSILIRGFVSAVVNTIDHERLRTHVDQLVMTKLRGL